MKKYIKKWLGIDEDIRKSIVANSIFGCVGTRFDKIEGVQNEICIAIRDIKETECENSGHNWFSTISDKKICTCDGIQSVCSICSKFK